MPLPLFLTASLCFSLPPVPTPPARPRSDARSYHRLLRNEEFAAPEDRQFILIQPPPPAAPGRAQMMPLQAGFSLDARAQSERDEADLIAAINAERAGHGLDPLTPDPLLTDTARAHSREMCDLAYFDHHSPTPGLATPLARYLSALRAWGAGRPPAALVGENIFFCSVTSSIYNAGYAHQSFMDSPGHRANILEPRFTKVGVGLYRDDQGRFWVTEMFLRDQ